MKTCIRNVRLVLTDDIVSGAILIEDGRILQIGEDFPADEIVDGEGMYLAPGFVDLHSHGGGGYDFLDGTPQALETISRFHALHGTTTMIPTYTSSDREELLGALDCYEACGNMVSGAQFPGVHLEGPYFSPKQMGAQDPRYLRGFDEAEYGRILEHCGHILRWSVAPELPGMEAFAAAMRERGILLSIAHSDAVWEEVCAARACGFTHVTHLYSCTSTVVRRNAFRYAGIIESAYLYDDMTVEIIADGCHLPKPLLQLVVKLKGRENTALVTDSMSGAGSPPGESFIGSKKHGQPVIIEDGVAKVMDRSCFAGSVATMDRLVRTMVNTAGVRLADAVYMASTTPARIQGLAGKGKLAPGYDADMVLLDDTLTPRGTFVKGRKIL